MRRTLVAATLTTALALGVLGGCGGGGDDISTSARDRLAPLVSQVRSAAEGSDPYGTALALADVRSAVKQLRAEGAIGDLRAQEILAATAGVERQIALVPTTTTTALPPTTLALPPPPENDDRGKGGGKGKGGKD
jgi:hypothetical protein